MLKTHYQIQGMRTDNPGIWTDPENKICALGVHLRRNVTSHGIGLNLTTEMGWFERIVACGLEGKKTTNLQLCLGRREDVSVERVAGMFVQRFGEGLEGVEAVEEIGEGDVE